MMLNRPRIVPLPFDPEKYGAIRMLWIKVIIRAAYDYALWKESNNVRLRRMAEDAFRWLFAESTLANSFQNICIQYSLPMMKIRAYAKRLTREDVRKLEFGEIHRDHDKGPIALLPDDLEEEFDGGC